MPWTANSGKTLKRPEEYSTNPNTIRARKRKAGLSPYQRETEQAKASDTKAVTRAWKIYVETDAYKMANAEERKMILETVENQVMERRRSKGYDAKSKIQNFLYRQGLASSTTPPKTPATATSSTIDSKVDPDLEHIIQSPAPSGYGMQPVAPMHATPHGHQQHSFNTPSRPMLQTPIGAYTYGFGNHDESSDAVTINRLQTELAAEAMTKETLQVKVREHDEKVDELEKHIELLTNDLVVTKGSLRAQEDRMQQIDARMRAYDGTAAGLNGAEVDYFTQATKLHRVISGVQKIAEVLGEVAQALVDDRASSSGIDNVINAANNQDLDMTEAHINSTIGANDRNSFYDTGGDNISSS